MYGYSWRRISGVTALTLVALFLVTALLFGLAASCKGYNRYQRRADANNKVKVTAIQIREATQRIEVEKKLNEVKHQHAIGQRKANEEIAKKLTPMFIQFEALEAMRETAAAGNSTVIYIPVGANGVPLVSVTGEPQVLGGDSGGK